MPNAELIQSAAQFANQARELLGVGTRTNLLQTLTDLGHPYGLLFGMNANSWPSILLCPSASSSVSADWSGNSATPDPLSSLPFSGAFLVNFSIVNTLMFEKLLKQNRNFNPNHEYLHDEHRRVDEYDNSNFCGRLSRRFQFSSEFKYGGCGYDASFYGFLLTVLSKSSVKLLAKNNQDFNNFLNSQMVLAPGILKSLTELDERPRNLWVGRNQIGLGSSSIHLGTYKEEMPYVIKSPAGDSLAQINPGDTLGSIHVSGQANLLKNLSPLEKIEQITEDFIDLLKAVDGGGSSDFNEAQQKTLAKAGSATFIGISHLVRLFGRKTGLPTWKLDVLPELVQKFHQHDSQVVSRTFGGTRKVKPSDVEMMVVTPEIRRQLVATV